MRRLSKRLLAAAGLVIVAGIPLRSIYIGVEARRVPVARIASNLEKQLKATPKDADLHVKLARLYGMAYAINAEEVPVAKGRGGEEEVWFGHEPNLVPHGSKLPADTPRVEASRKYLQLALEHYRTAIGLDSNSLIARLGYGWGLEQSGDKAGAIAAYRAVVTQAWPKEQSATSADLGQRFYTAEAGEYLIPLLDPGRDAKEIEELRSRVTRLRSMPRPITPVAVPLSDGLTPGDIVDLEARVPFDADGSGLRQRWTWISRDAGWLVYDSAGTGRITSALQWFGNVSFWLMWRNGYEALGALDDDGDGSLRGAELRYLAIWNDRNSDGVSAPQEVRSLRDHGIRAVSCRFTAGDGLLTAARSAEGIELDTGRVRPTYDVILRLSRSVSAP